MRALGLEAPPSGETSMAGEALASTVEETVRDLLELPAEAFEDTLRMEGEIQQSFAQAAARNLPSQLLRPDLPERETAGEGGIWVLMPRAARPRFRYKKYSRVFLLPISRQTARAIPTTDGGTLETTLLDRGVASWPAQGEVHLYETVIGSQLGHLARFETEDEAPFGEALAEFQPLTEETASLLLREPALGKPAAAAFGDRPGRLLRPGKRFYRVRLPGQLRLGTARPRRRFRIVFDLLQRNAQIRVHLLLSEREGQKLAERLDRREVPRVLAWLKDRYQRLAPAVFTARILRHSQTLPGGGLAPAAAERLAALMTEALTQALSTFLKDRHGELAAAVRDPSQGVTLTFTFAAPEWATLLRAPISQPTITAQPGWHRG
jgi:hypothetical protein